MNLPNKLSMIRIILSVVIITLLVFPFQTAGIDLPQLFINEKIVINIKYLIAGGLFIIASLTDFLDGYIARKYDMVTDFGKLIDAIADKMLVNSVLIILSASGFIHPIIPIIIILRDTLVNTIKMIAASKGRVVAAIKSGKLKTICLMLGVSLTLFYNMPFELYNLRIADFLLFIATVMSLVSGIQYYIMNRHIIIEQTLKK